MSKIIRSGAILNRAVSYSVWLLGGLFVTPLDARVKTGGCVSRKGVVDKARSKPEARLTLTLTQGPLLRYWRKR